MSNRKVTTSVCTLEHYLRTKSVDMYQKDGFCFIDVPEKELKITFPLGPNSVNLHEFLKYVSTNVHPRYQFTFSIGTYLGQSEIDQVISDFEASVSELKKSDDRPIAPGIPAFYQAQSDYSGLVCTESIAKQLAFDHPEFVWEEIDGKGVFHRPSLSLSSIQKKAEQLLEGIKDSPTVTLSQKRLTNFVKKTGVSVAVTRDLTIASNTSVFTPVSPEDIDSVDKIVYKGSKNLKKRVGGMITSMLDGKTLVVKDFVDRLMSAIEDNCDVAVSQELLLALLRTKQGCLMKIGVDKIGLRINRQASKPHVE